MIEAKSRKKVIINESYCKECGLCIKFCPEKSIKIQTKFNEKGFHPAEWSGSCNFCGICYTVCPDFAIEITEDEKPLER